MLVDIPDGFSLIDSEELHVLFLIRTELDEVQAEVRRLQIENKRLRELLEAHVPDG